MLMLSKERQFLEDICAQRNLKFEAVYNTGPGKTSKSDESFLVQNIRTFGLAESEIVFDLHSGIKELLDIENRFKPDEKPENPEKVAEKPEKVVEPAKKLFFKKIQKIIS